jgi:plastocyanin
MRRTPLTSLLAVALIGFAGCGDDDDDEPAATSGGTSAPAGTDGTAAPAGGSGLTISGFAFPAGVSGAAGATITVVNDDPATHTVTADDGAFDVEVGGGEQADLVLPDEPGTYAFHCNIHGSMQGSLVVE